MALNVNPSDLVSTAAALAEMAQLTGTVLPKGWVVPAGADPISAQAVPQLNAQAQHLYNGVLGMLNEVHRTAHNVGGAAADYTKADDQGARQIAGSGSDQVTNPVAETPPHTPRFAPNIRFPAAGVAVDPLTFAQQLHSGPGPGGAARFAENVRSYLTTTHADATDGLDRSSVTMRNWTPVGSAAAQELDDHRNWLGRLGSALSQLADGADTYSNAFTTAKAKHPTPQEIIAARKELVAAMRSKNELGVADALAKFHEQNARSAQTIGDYATTVNSEDATGTNTAGEAGASGGGDMRMLAQMLPSMMSSMMQAGSMAQMGGLGQSEDALSGYDDYGYGDYYGDYGSYGDYGGGAMPIGDITGGIDGGIPSVSVGPMPMVGSATSASTLRGSTGGTASSMPRAAVAESLGSPAGPAGRGAHSPYMPYMPMSPGMGGMGGGGAGNDRNRVVAWHPDRLMYVDDTPHTEQVIGEKPTIAPTVTPATPSPANQTPSPSGGNA